MPKEVKGKFTKGKIELMEDAELKEGQEVKVVVPSRQARYEMIERLKTTAGGWKGLIEGEGFLRMIYEDRLKNSRQTPRP